MDIKIIDDESYKIQILRGLAIAAVVYIHCLPADFTQVYMRPFLNFSVGLFLFLSGFLSCKTSNRKKRLCKVILPYALWTSFYMTIRYVCSDYSFEKFIYLLLKAFLLADSAAMMYYIFVYIQFILLLPLIDRIASSKFRFFPFLLIPFEIFFMRLAPVFGWYEVNLLSDILRLSFVPWLGYFYLGYLFRNSSFPVKIKTNKLLFYLIVSVIIQFFEGWYYYEKNIVNCGTQLKFSSILTGIIFSCIAYNFITEPFNHLKNVFCKILKILGDYSFGIFFIHIFFIMVFSKILNPNPFFNGILTLVCSVFAIFVTRKVLRKYASFFGF